MARARNIKPSFFTNEDLAELAYETRLLFVGTWCLADRAGRLEDRPKKIKMAIFPADSIDVNKLLLQLHESKFILRYEVDGKHYIQVIKFLKHQNPHHREPASTLPAAPESLVLEWLGNGGEPGAGDLFKDHRASGPPGASRADSGFRIPDSGSLIPDSPSRNKDTVGLPPDAAGPGKKNGHDAEKTRELRQQAVVILNFLNEKAGKNYQPVATNINLIVARLKEGGTADDMRAIIAKKCREWRGRDGMEEFLRPATLFGAKNFWQKYQGELAAAGPKPAEGAQ